MKDWMTNYSLNQIEEMYHDGLLSEQEVEEYILKWNTNIDRLSYARFSGYNIYTRPIE